MKAISDDRHSVSAEDLSMARVKLPEAHADRYRLLAELGGGRTGISYLATPRHPPEAGNYVVVRVLRHELLDEESVIRAFAEQARLAFRLEHRNIVRGLDSGLQDGRPFAATEYVDGLSLDRLLNRARQREMPLSLAMKFRIVLDVLSAVHFAHSIGRSKDDAQAIVHGQLTPRKVFVTTSGHVKVIDFGFPHTAVVPNETPTAPLFGGVRYAAPEVVLDKTVDGRADVFAVGALLWELMLGHPPWDDRPDPMVLLHLISGRLPHPAEIARTADPSLRAIVQRAMARDPDRRYPSALALRFAIERYASARMLESPPGNVSNSKEARWTDRQALGALVTGLFADDRRAIMESADERLRRGANVERPGSGLVTESSVTAAPTTSSAMPRDPAPKEPSQSSASSPGRRWSPKWRRLYGSTLLLAVVTGTVGFCKRVERNDAHRPASSLSDGATSSPALPAPQGTRSAPAATAPPPQLAQVSIRVLPPSAKLFLDGSAIPNPYIGQVRSDAFIHTLHAEARGYLPRTRSIVFQTDSSIEIELEARPQRQPADPLAVRSPSPASTTPAPNASSDVLIGIDKANPYQP